MINLFLPVSMRIVLVLISTLCLAQLFAKLQAVKAEIHDVQEEHIKERQELEQTQNELTRELKLKYERFHISFLCLLFCSNFNSCSWAMCHFPHNLLPCLSFRPFLLLSCFYLLAGQTALNHISFLCYGVVECVCMSWYKKEVGIA